MHDVFEFVVGHLAMADVNSWSAPRVPLLGHDMPCPYARIVKQSPEPVGDGFNTLDAVVQEINLSAAVQLALDRRPYQSFIVSGNHCLDGQPILWRRLDGAHVARACEREIERPRNRRRRQRDNVHQLA